MAGATLTATRAGSAVRRSGVIRITHWLTFAAFMALLITGGEILLSHPRFYWGNEGNVNTAGLFRLPFPSSRDTFPTTYGYVLPDQNGWSRYLHFEAAWVAVLTGAVYVAYGLLSGYFRRNLWPLRDHFSSYNVPQRITYLIVIFMLFPLVIWTGLAMSPGFVSVCPFVESALGGRQSARTIHFFVSVVLFVFFLVHVGMVIRAGFLFKMRGMVTGRVSDGGDL